MEFKIQVDSQLDRDTVICAVTALSPLKPWLVSIKELKPKRSLNQNSLFHAWLQIIAESTGNDLEDVKNALKDLYLPLKVVKVGKVERMVRTETSSLDVGDMAAFMDRVQYFAATELGITLPTTEPT